MSEEEIKKINGHLDNIERDISEIKSDVEKIGNNCGKLKLVIILGIISLIVLSVGYYFGVQYFASNISSVKINITAIVCITAAFIAVLICLTVVIVKLICCCKKGKNNSDEVPDIVIRAYKKIFNDKSDNSKQSEKANTEQGSKT